MNNVFVLLLFASVMAKTEELKGIRPIEGLLCKEEFIDLSAGDSTRLGKYSLIRYWSKLTFINNAVNGEAPDTTLVYQQYGLIGETYNFEVGSRYLFTPCVVKISRQIDPSGFCTGKLIVNNRCAIKKLQ